MEEAYLTRDHLLHSEPMLNIVKDQYGIVWNEEQLWKQKKKIRVFKSSLWSTGSKQYSSGL